MKGTIGNCAEIADEDPPVVHGHQYVRGTGIRNSDAVIPTVFEQKPTLVARTVLIVPCNIACVVDAACDGGACLWNINLSVAAIAEKIAVIDASQISAGADDIASRVNGSR